MNKLLLAVAACLTACAPPSTETVKAIAETCIKAGMVARYDGINGQVYCVTPSK